MTQRALPVKYNLDLLIKFCNENHITLLKDYSKKNNEDDKPKLRGLNRDTIIECICEIDYCEKIFKKSFRNLYEKNGYCRKHAVEHANKKD